MKINKQSYLEDDDVKRFVHYLSGLLANRNSFAHTYDTKKSKKNWSFNSLEDAKKQYSWSSGIATSFDANKKILIYLSKNLKEAFNGNDEKGALSWCLQVLEWGGVQNGAYGLAKLYCEGNLIKNLNNAL